MITWGKAGITMCAHATVVMITCLIISMHMCLTAPMAEALDQDCSFQHTPTFHLVPPSYVTLLGGCACAQAISDFDAYDLNDVDAAFALAAWEQLRYFQHFELTGGDAGYG